MSESAAITCSLTQTQMKKRTEYAAEIAEGRLLDLTTSGAKADLVFASTESSITHFEEFVDAESKCCPFFTFKVEPAGETVRLSIEAPEDAAPLTRGLVAGFTAGWSLNP
jgi:hypothetical protein